MDKVLHTAINKEKNMYYTIDIAGMKRDLRLYTVSPDTKIGAFIMFGDVEITEYTSKKLLELAPEFDYIITSEAKSIPLAYEMARQAGMNDYIVARKSLKVYMENPVGVELKSITTANVQTLYLGDSDVEKIRGKRILIVDDVISTGESLAAMEKLVNAAEGIIVGKLSVLAEGKAAEREDITFLQKLPLFNADGTVKDI